MYEKQHDQYERKRQVAVSLKVLGEPTLLDCCVFLSVGQRFYDLLQGPGDFIIVRLNAPTERQPMRIINKQYIVTAAEKPAAEAENVVFEPRSVET
ncbi:MAG: hypothetical protein QF893_11645 [Alphaproteobacteria bacterium]|nr:hypothetical protein [Alphaproteobacteria bacterium]